MVSMAGCARKVGSAAISCVAAGWKVISSDKIENTGGGKIFKRKQKCSYSEVLREMPIRHPVERSS